MAAEIRLVAQGLAKLAQALQAQPAAEETSDAITQALEAIRRRVAGHVPVKRGVLRASVRQRVYAGRMSGEVTAGGRGARHAHLIELGVKPHKVVAGKAQRKRNKRLAKKGRALGTVKRALALPGGIFRASATPGGFAGVHFMKRGLADAQPDVERTLREAGLAVVTNLARYEGRRRRGRRK
jgi:hypothetical protein